MSDKAGEMDARDASPSAPLSLTWAGGMLAFGLMTLLMLAPLLRFAVTTASWLGYPYPRAGSEGLILYETLLVKHGGDIYAPITPDSFISGPYPPVYYWLAAAVVPDRLPDFSRPGAVSSVFEPGRVISLASTFVAGAALILLVVFEAREPLLRRSRIFLTAVGGYGGAILFLTLPQVMVWATRFRGDMLMIALTALGLASVAGGWLWRERAGAKWTLLLFGALFFALALYTKQTALAGPLAAAAYLLLCDWRTGLKWCAPMALAVLVPFAALDVATGNWFYLKMVSYHSLALSSSTLMRLLQFAFWEDEWPLILLALAFVIFTIYEGFVASRQSLVVSGRSLAGKRPTLVTCFVLASLVTLPTGAVVGADHNHLLMPGLAVCAAVGAALARLLARLIELLQAALDSSEKRAGVREPFTLAASGVALLLVATYALLTSPPSSWYSPDLTLPDTRQQEQLRQIAQKVQQEKGTLFFSDDPGYVALGGKETSYDDPFTMTALARQGRWDEAAYRDRLRQGKFALLVLSCNVIEAPDRCRSDTFTPGVLDAIRSGYDILFRDILFTYVPKR